MAVVVSIAMGYGHLRAAFPLAQRLGTRVERLDEAPLASGAERGFWRLARGGYEGLSRITQHSWSPPAAVELFERLTAIRPANGSLDAATASLGWLVERGLGQGLVDELRERGKALVTTHFIPAWAAERAGHAPTYCVATDTDLHRIWAGPEPRSGPGRFLVPTRETAERLRGYGVAPERIHVTGFPLPVALTEAASLRAALARRLRKLDPRGLWRRDALASELEELGATLPQDDTPPLIGIAVGGAGAQSALATSLLTSLRELLERRRLRLALIAGTRAEVAALFETALKGLRLAEGARRNVSILLGRDVEDYILRFQELVQELDALWTKPSELSFYAALGLPLVLAPPVGAHEAANRDWLLSHEAALCQAEPARAGEWLAGWLDSGALARVALMGYRKLERNGTERVAALVRSGA